ncbi:sugar transferase [Williamsia serinedens]|uniref:Undecaprenyl-phosphate glucose phosphotransferase n=1 Tax=Williamsia serinedens TaxID=391736 RepID=A0ABT1H2B4_9NOCA|nr:sugar transferase [Williamsia serinedens]MCP2161385.1 Undecaprenyl-phosphate glucose phosphotransferase [Williamsia serinedens]
MALQTASAPSLTAAPAIGGGADTAFLRQIRRDPGHSIVTVVIDVVAASVAVIVGSLWADATQPQHPPLWALWLFVPTVVMTFALQQMYRKQLRRNFLDELAPVMTALAVAAVVTLAFIVTFVTSASQTGITTTKVWVCAVVLVTVGRFVRVVIQRNLRTKRGSLAPTLVVGDGPVAHQLIARMKEMPEYGLRPVGILAATPLQVAGDAPAGDAVSPDVPRLGPPRAVADAIAATQAEEIVVAAEDMDDDQLARVVRAAHRRGIRAWVLPRAHDAVGARARIDHLGGVPLLILPRINPRSWQFTVKHAFDRTAGALGLLMISPIFLTLMLLVRLSSPGPIFFSQERVGRNGKVFGCLKFRSMRPPTEADKAFELKAGAAPGGVEGVDRRTKVGKIMRSTSLDELPQLINVVRGDMSLVGPRPERPEFVELFEMQIRRYGERHRVKAGVTGWAQVHGLRGQTSIADRAEWDNYYIENWSLALDLKILALTVLTVFHRAE